MGLADFLRPFLASLPPRAPVVDSPAFHHSSAFAPPQQSTGLLVVSSSSQQVAAPSPSYHDTSSSIISVTSPTANLNMLSRTAAVVDPLAPPPTSLAILPTSTPGPAPVPIVTSAAEDSSTVDPQLDLLTQVVNQSIGSVTMEADEEVLDFGGGVTVNQDGQAPSPPVRFSPVPTPPVSSQGS